MSKMKNERMPEADSSYPNEERYIAQLKQIFSTYDDLIVFAARMMHSEAKMADEIERLNRLLDEQQVALNSYFSEGDLDTAEQRIILLEMFRDAGNGTAQLLMDGLALQKRSKAIKAVKVKLANDPKQVSKALVKECWAIWQTDSSRYRSKSAFAKDMLTKFENLDSQTVITRWCKEWEEGR